MTAEPTHVDDWLDAPAKDEQERLAKEWVEHFRRPATHVDHKWLDSFCLLCKYRDKVYRCIGASRMGDLWLTSKLETTRGYELRIDVAECSDWVRMNVVPGPVSTSAYTLAKK